MRMFVLLGTMVFAHAAWAANLAYDDASDPAYGGLWLDGSNGGYGFGAWQLTNAGPISGHGIASSTLNGDGVDDGSINGNAGDGDIDTGFIPSAWGLIADIGANAQAIRPFTGGPLNVGQTFSVDFDNGLISFGGVISVAMVDALNNPVMAVSFTSGFITNYYYVDAGGFNDTGLAYGDEGLNLTVTMTGATNYQATLTRRDNISVSWSGSMLAAPEAFLAVARDVGPEPLEYFFINSMSIVPEPSTIALGALGLLGVVVRALRRRWA